MIPLPTEGDYVRILADGAIRSIVQRILPAWNIGGEIRQLTSTTFIYGENPWVEHHIRMDGDLPPDYAFITGVPYPNDPNAAYNEDEKQGWVLELGNRSTRRGYTRRGSHRPRQS